MKTREIVYYHEQHTMMTQDVTVHIDEKVLRQMLAESISEDSKRELIQTYYICRLAQEIKIEGKHNYGDWNAAIGDISSIYAYEDEIIKKIMWQVSVEDMEKQFALINQKILALSEKEHVDSLEVQKKFLTRLNLKGKSFKVSKI